MTQVSDRSSYMKRPHLATLPQPGLDVSISSDRLRSRNITTYHPHHHHEGVSPPAPSPREGITTYHPHHHHERVSPPIPSPREGMALTTHSIITGWYHTHHPHHHHVMPPPTPPTRDAITHASTNTSH